MHASVDFEADGDGVNASGRLLTEDDRGNLLSTPLVLYEALEPQWAS